MCVGAGNVARDADGAATEAGSLHRQVQGDPGEGKGTRLYVMMDSISYELEMEFLNDIVSVLRIRKKVSDPDPDSNPDSNPESSPDSIRIRILDSDLDQKLAKTSFFGTKIFRQPHLQT
jgi:hypothetical protein